MLSRGWSAPGVPRWVWRERLNAAVHLRDAPGGSQGSRLLLAVVLLLRDAVLALALKAVP